MSWVVVALVATIDSPVCWGGPVAIPGFFYGGSMSRLQQVKDMRKAVKDIPITDINKRKFIKAYNKYMKGIDSLLAAANKNRFEKIDFIITDRINPAFKALSKYYTILNNKE